MAYSAEHLENSRKAGFEPLDVLHAVLSSLLELRGQSVELLDCGCGTGFFTRQYAKIDGVNTVGVDIDEPLLQAAREIAEKEGVRASFEKGDITQLPYASDRFDVVASDILLESFDDKALPIGELVRVCRPGGKVLCMEPNYQSYVHYDPRRSESENLSVIRAENKRHPFGAGVVLPDIMRRAGLKDIRLVPWLWGGLKPASDGTLILDGIDVYLVCGIKGA